MIRSAKPCSTHVSGSRHLLPSHVAWRAGCASTAIWLFSDPSDCARLRLGIVWVLRAPCVGCRRSAASLPSCAGPDCAGPVGRYRFRMQNCVNILLGNSMPRCTPNLLHRQCLTQTASQCWVPENSLIARSQSEAVQQHRGAVLHGVRPRLPKEGAGSGRGEGTLLLQSAILSARCACLGGAWMECTGLCDACLASLGTSDRTCIHTACLQCMSLGLG